MNRILVTGATGGLGRNAVQTLLKKGVAVRATGRNVEAGKILSALGAGFIALNLATASPAQVADLVRDVDTIWHCAALSSPWGAASDFTAANVTATQRLLRAAGQSCVTRFIHISTPAIYFDYTNHFEVKETFCPKAYVNAYARTKAQAEASVLGAVKQFPRMHCTILRPRAIFGPYDQVLIPRFLRLLTDWHGKLALPRGGSVTLDMTYVENVVHAMYLAVDIGDVPSGTAFNITNQEPVVLRDILPKLLTDALQRQIEIVTLPYPLLLTAAHCMQALSYFTRKEPKVTPYGIGAISFDMTLDNTKAKQILKYVPTVSLSEGIRRTSEWLKHNG